MRNEREEMATDLKNIKNENENVINNFKLIYLKCRLNGQILLKI